MSENKNQIKDDVSSSASNFDISLLNKLNLNVHLINLSPLIKKLFLINALMKYDFEFHFCLKLEPHSKFLNFFMCIQPGIK